MNRKGISPMATASSPDTTIAASAVWSMVEMKGASAPAALRDPAEEEPGGDRHGKVQSAPAAASRPSSASVCGRMRTTPSTTPHR